MELEITFRDGPIEAKVSAGKEDDYTEVLEELADFVDQYGTVQSQTSSPEPEMDQGENSQETIKQYAEGQSADKVPEGNESGEEESNPLFSRVEATETELQRVLKMGQVENGEIKQFPEIVRDTSVLGNSKQDRLVGGSVVLLTVLDDLHGISKVKTTDLREALGESGLDTGVWANVSRVDNVDVYLNRTGQGSGGMTEIRKPGKEDAYDYIQAMVDRMRSEDEDASE